LPNNLLRPFATQFALVGLSSVSLLCCLLALWAALFLYTKAVLTPAGDKFIMLLLFLEGHGMHGSKNGLMVRMLCTRMPCATMLVALC
jgi:hypothetical protein